MNPPTYSLLASSEVVLADARPAALIVPASQLAVVLEPCESLLHIVSFCPHPDHSVPTLCLPSRADSLGQRTFCLRHRLPFPLVLNSFLLVFGLFLHFLSLVFEFLDSRPTSLTVRSGPSSSVSTHPVSHVSRKQRFSPTFPLPYPTLTSRPVDQAPVLVTFFSYSVSSIYRIMIMTITHDPCLTLLSFLFRQIVRFSVPPQFLVPRPIRFGTDRRIHWNTFASLISVCTHVCHGFPKKEQFLSLTLRINGLTTPVEFV